MKSIYYFSFGINIDYFGLLINGLPNPELFSQQIVEISNLECRLIQFITKKRTPLKPAHLFPFNWVNSASFFSN
jgi:hypothetical protein